jgi:hypothetical protein
MEIIGRVPIFPWNITLAPIAAAVRAQISKQTAECYAKSEPQRRESEECARE